jgi:hypothetical protein
MVEFGSCHRDRNQMQITPITRVPAIAAAGLRRGGTSDPLLMANKGHIHSKKKLEMAKIRCIVE